jgi:5'-nucleotidase
MEGRCLGLPSIAISLVAEGRCHFATAARVARELIERLLHAPLPQAALFNVNVPDRPYAELAGFMATRLGVRHRSERIVRATDPRGRPVYWVGAPGAGQDAGPGTDFHAVEHGYVSITPLQIDLTRHGALEGLGAWLANAHG